MGSLRNTMKNIYKLMFRPIYKSLEAEIANREADKEIFQNQISALRSEIDGIHNSMHYIGDTLAEMSYLIQTNSAELKRSMYEMKKMDIRLHTIANTDTTITKKIVQIVPVFRRGDAIGDYALHIDRVLREAGFDTAIYAYQNLSDLESIQSVEDLTVHASDVILLHMAAANDFAEIMEAYPAKKVLFYHNITPSEFFEGFDEEAEQSTKTGREQLKKLISVVDCCITDSKYNREDLRQIGYTCPIHVLPIPFEKKNYEGIEVPAVKETLSDGKTNLIFVGRIAPNKKIEDVIRCYQIYKQIYNPNARLILVGGYQPEGKYYQYLKQQIKETDDILMTGHIGVEEWVTYYKNADIFLCMSEHEGFCVPLIEAMSYQIPIVAYHACAVPETLGEGGILLTEKNMEAFAEVIHQIVISQEKREYIQRKQLQEMKKYDVFKLETELKNCIRMILEEKKND